MPEIETVTPAERQAIEELRSRIEHELPPSLLKDETLYYRFLKARDFNLKNAEAMLRKHISDRKFYGAEDILTNYTPPEHIQEYFPVSLIGYDKEGCPVRYISFGEADHKGILGLYDFKTIIRYNVSYLEKDVERMAEQSKKLGKPVTKLVAILNMDKLNLFQATYKKGIETMLDGFKLYQDNYPERIKKIYIINTSFYFNMAYSIVKHCLASALIQKIDIFGRDGWKEALLEAIDPEVLPAFLGGNRTDPDGNPLCPSFVAHGKKVPEELYLKKYRRSLSQENGVKKLTVTRFSSSEILFYIYEPNTIIEWEFETKTRDIAFGLYYKDTSKIDPKVEELIPKQRTETILSSETGVYKCDKSGTYIIMFDNSYSWIYSKEIFYRIRLIKPNQKTAQTN